MAHYLSEDLITEIFYRLPIKTLFRCKCLSKSWEKRISNVCIPRVLRPPSPLCGFLFRAGNFTSERDDSFFDYVSYCDDNTNNKYNVADGFVESYSSLLPSEYSPYDVVDCCNGLILLASKKFYCYYVCNPANKQCLAIPKNCAHLKVYHASLVFEPHKSSHYKVICYKRSCMMSPSHPPVLDIFSSGTRAWVKRDIFFKPPVRYGVSWLKRSVYLDGMLYNLSNAKYLLCLDINALTVDAIDLPYKDRIDEFGLIGVSKGVLHYANLDGSTLMVWQFDFHCKTGSFWLLKHRICIQDLLVKHPDGHSLVACLDSPMFKPYAIHPTSDIIFLGIPEMLFSYHPAMHKLELVCRRLDDKKISFGQYFVFTYSPCFIMLNDLSSTLRKFSRMIRQSSHYNDVEKLEEYELGDNT